MHDAVLVYAETSGYVGTSKSETSCMAAAVGRTLIFMTSAACMTD